MMEYYEIGEEDDRKMARIPNDNYNEDGCEDCGNSSDDDTSRWHNINNAISIKMIVSRRQHNINNNKERRHNNKHFNDNSDDAAPLTSSACEWRGFRGFPTGMTNG